MPEPIMRLHERELLFGQLSHESFVSALAQECGSSALTETSTWAGNKVRVSLTYRLRGRVLRTSGEANWITWRTTGRNVPEHKKKAIENARRLARGSLLAALKAEGML
jgi:hypothetical protein